MTAKPSALNDLLALRKRCAKSPFVLGREKRDKVITILLTVQDDDALADLGCRGGARHYNFFGRSWTPLQRFRENHANYAAVRDNNARPAREKMLLIVRPPVSDDVTNLNVVCAARISLWVRQGHGTCSCRSSESRKNDDQYRDAFHALTLKNPGHKDFVAALKAQDYLTLEVMNPAIYRGARGWFLPSNNL